MQKHTHIQIPYRDGTMHVVGNATADKLKALFRSNERIRRRWVLLNHLKTNR